MAGFDLQPWAGDPHPQRRCPCHSGSDRVERRSFRPHENRATVSSGGARILLHRRAFLFLFRSRCPAAGRRDDLLARRPIYVAALSPFLPRKVGWRRWTAIAIGFVGVLIALQPSSASLTSAALFSILGSAAFAFMMLSGRQLRNTPDTVLAFWQIIGAGLAGLVAVFVTPSGWLPVQSGFDLAFLGLLGVVAMAAHAGQPRSEARGRRDRRAAAIHIAALGGGLWLAVL